MATAELLQSLRQLAATRTFRTKARFYAPAYLTELLESVACADELALLVDVDALERSTLARSDRVMVLALEALSQVRVQIVIVACAENAKAPLLHRAVPGSWCIDRERAVGHVRERSPDARVIAISDDLELLGSIGVGDRGLALARGNGAQVSNVAMTGEVSVRAALWWLVDVRARAGAA
jgi:hypothetical protein